jgi:hypothetical protein
MADLYLHDSALDASVEKVIAKGVFGTDAVAMDLPPGHRK